MLKTKISTLKEIHDMRANSFGKVKHFGFGWLAGCDTCQFQSPSFKHARLCFFLVMFSSTGISRTLTCLISSSRIKCTNRLQNLLYVWYTNVKTNIKLYTAWGLPWILWTHLWATEQITQHRGVMFFWWYWPPRVDTFNTPGLNGYGQGPESLAVYRSWRILSCSWRFTRAKKPV